MSKLMTTRWPILLFGQSLLTIGINGIINLCVRSESSGHTFSFLIGGVIGLAIIVSVAFFALSGSPFLPDHSLNLIYSSSMMPISSQPGRCPFSFVVALFMIPIFAIPMIQIDLFFGFNDSRKYLGLLIGPGVFLLGCFGDFVFRRIAGNESSNRNAKITG